MGSKHGIPPAFYLTLVMIVLALRIPETLSQLIDSSSGGSLQAGSSMLDQANNVSDPMDQPDDTVRVDPLDSFKKYRGGYDITNKHYWSSTIFTGVYGYVPGVLWLVCGILYGGFSLAIMLWQKYRKSEKLKKRSACHKQCYLWPILLAIFFTLLAIVASGVVLGGNARFHSQAKTVVDIVIDTANEASETIYNTTGAMKVIRDNLEASGTSIEAEVFLTSTSQELDVEAADIHRQAKKNRHKIDKGLKIVFIVTTLTISLNLVAVIALSVSGILRLWRALLPLIILCWLLTFLCWLFFGMYFFLDKFAGDTCTALENFQRNPYNSSLSSILPCDELLSAKSVLRDVNANISLLQQSNDISICNPFSEPPAYQYQPENCSSNTIRIGDIPKVLKVITCSDPNNMTCGNGQFMISTGVYQIVESYTSSIQDLLNAYPGMESLVECQSVKDAFSEILVKHCKPLKRFIHMVWASVVFLSLIMVCLVLLWTTRAHHELSHHFSDGGSVGPHSSAANMLELGNAKPVKDNPNLISV
ncbi:Transmembrane protein [Parasponia andersonii]|uniref:Transmembrane protein n=1 Tax=Parasponia andersonii TaxID=3476 RepID=A0A2P5CR75_PARAD|nr:Transmembrane protein [Parasponia andersonii]